MDESISFIENWETWNNSAEWVTEQDIQKIQEEARQIKKVAQELKNSKAANGQFAKFLSFLMRTITNEDLIKALYDTFYTALDPKTHITYLRKNANVVVICGLFYPFFQEEAHKYNLHQLFQPLLKESSLTIKGYLEYLKGVSRKFHDNVPLNQGDLITLILYIAQEYLSQASDAPHLEDGDRNQSYKTLIQQYLQ